jgi:[ribosomal protein S5]-alanine N-acetyltransferase
MNMNNPFTIDCGEIILREYLLDDAEAIYNLALEEEVNRFLPDWKTSREQRIEWLRDYEIPGNQAYLKALREGRMPEGYLRLGIILKENGQFIGWCCTGPKDELPIPNTEISYAVSKAYAGRGYVTKAAKALIHFLFTETKIHTLNALAEHDNIASIKVIQKCGFSYVGDLSIDHKRLHHYQITNL